MVSFVAFTARVTEVPLTDNIRIPAALRRQVADAVARIDGALGLVKQQLNLAFGNDFPNPRDFQAISDRLKGLTDALTPVGNKAADDIILPTWFADLLKTSLSHERRAIADQVATFRQRAADSESVSTLDARLEPFEYFATQEWFTAAKSLRVPFASDYLTPQYRASTVFEKTPDQDKPQFDPKAGILYSARQLLVDLTLLRRECDSRRLGLTIAFLDIDNFKPLNTQYGEPVVDRDLLPAFMRTLSDSFFGRGRCYRYGGDEFVVLIPNAPRPVLTPVLAEMQAALSQLEYVGIPERPTVSVGICELSADASLTDGEALSAASRAKQFAKNAGRNCAAGIQVVEYLPTEPMLWD